MEGFTTIEYIISWPGMILVVVMATQFTKTMIDSVVKLPTMYVVYFWALWLCLVAMLFSSDLNTLTSVASSIIVWFINSIIVWFAAMKSFELYEKRKKRTPK